MAPQSKVRRTGCDGACRIDVCGRVAQLFCGGEGGKVTVDGGWCGVSTWVLVGGMMEVLIQRLLGAIILSV